MESDNNFVPVAVAATQASVPVRTVYDWAQRNRVATEQPAGEAMRVNLADVLRLAAQRRVGDGKRAVQHAASKQLQTQPIRAVAAPDCSNLHNTSTPVPYIPYLRLSNIDHP